MAKKKTREKDGLKWVSLQLMAGMTRDEVWRAYKEACQEVHEVTEEDFVALMQPVSVLLAKPYACVMNDVWEGVIRPGSQSCSVSGRAGGRDSCTTTTC